MKSNPGVAYLLAGVGALATVAVHAQAVSGNSGSDPGAANTTMPSLSEVVVTGSRVITNGNNSPTPLTVVNPNLMLQLQPTTIADGLNLMPQLQGSQSTNTAAGGGQRNGAGEYLNLRDLGDLRTLVLFDGQRVVPTINQNEADVDASIVPQMLLKRVDIVTGGVSAVYGSDAVSGVANFVTDNHFDGLKAKVSRGISTYGDDGIWDFGVAAGRDLFQHRGHVEVSYQYHDDPGICCQDARPYFAAHTGEGGLGTAAFPYYSIPNARSSNSSFDGLITGGPLKGLEFSQNGILSPFVAGAATGVSNLQSGGDGVWNKMMSIKSGDTFHQLFARIDYDFTDSLHGFAEVGGTAEHTTDNYTNPTVNVSIGYDNPYLASIQQPYQGQLQAAAALNPNGSFPFSKQILAVPAGPEEQWTKALMFMSGLDGSIGKYKWTVAFDQSMSQVLAQNDANVNMGNFYAAANAIANPSTGQVSCNAALTNPGYAGCAPINLFGPTSESAAALDYITQATWNLNHTSLSELNASITGAPVDSWAGPVNMALSAEGRRTVWSVSSNASPNQFADCSGIQFSCTQGTTKTWLDGTMPANPAVTQNVQEVAYETDIPLAKGLPAIQNLSLNGAVRETHYGNSGLGQSSSFNATTWKLGLVWRLNDSLTLRGTRSRDIRAPNLWELYSPTTIATFQFTDPLTKSSGQLSQVVQSNPNLTPETADTVTGGFVYRPQYIRGFSLSMDYFEIKIANVIWQLQGQSPSVIQACDRSGGTSSLCSLIVRPDPISNTTAANFPTILLSQYRNIATLRTYGGDFEADYATDLRGHSLDLRLFASYQPHLILNQGPGGTLDLGDTFSGVNLFPASPSVKATFIGRYAVTQRFVISALERWRNSLKISGVPGLVFARSREPSVAYTTLNFSYTVASGSWDARLFLNVANLFNTYPTVYYSTLDHSMIPEGDDPVGRYFTMGFTLER